MTPSTARCTARTPSRSAATPCSGARARIRSRRPGTRPRAESYTDGMIPTVGHYNPTAPSLTPPLDQRPAAQRHPGRLPLHGRDDDRPQRRADVGQRRRHVNDPSNGVVYVSTSSAGCPVTYTPFTAHLHRQHRLRQRLRERQLQHLADDRERQRHHHQRQHHPHGHAAHGTRPQRRPAPRCSG